MSTYKKYPDSAKQPALKALYGVAEGMKGEDAVVEFIENMLTENEQLIIGRRVLLTQMLLTGHSHTEIKEKLHISPNTFVRLRRWAKKQAPNYNEIVKYFKEERSGETKRRSGFTFPFGGAKKKTPTHFLLTNIASDLLEIKK